MELSELRQQMAQQSQLIEELRQQNEKLQTASPEASAGAMA